MQTKWEWAGIKFMPGLVGINVCKLLFYCIGASMLLNQIYLTGVLASIIVNRSF